MTETPYSRNSSFLESNATKLKKYKRIPAKGEPTEARVFA